jgi:outer membrane protein, multidrug efflux system
MRLISDARMRSVLKAARVQREIAVTQFEQAIQHGFREVADVLAVRETVDQPIWTVR